MSCNHNNNDATESAILSVLCEYLFLKGYNQTLSAVETEIRLRNGDNNNNLTAYQDAILQKAFTETSVLESIDKGDYTEFQHLWDNNISKYAKDTELGLNLEFKINLYFAILPIKQDYPPNSPQVIQSMERFKNFLEKKTCQPDMEFMPLYALPYVKEVRMHPTFQHIFYPSWIQSLRADLQVFLNENVKLSTEPQLVKIYKNYNNNNNKSNDDSSEYQKSSAIELENLRTEYQRRSLTFIKRHKSLQEAYHTLIDIAMELVDSLEDSLKGEPISEEYVSNMCRKLFGISTNHSQHNISAGTSLIRASISSYSELMLTNTSPHKMHNMPLYPSLDYNKIKQDITILNSDCIGRILQALRLRLTQ